MALTTTSANHSLMIISVDNLLIMTISKQGEINT